MDALLEEIRQRPGGSAADIAAVIRAVGQEDVSVNDFRADPDSVIATLSSPSLLGQHSVERKAHFVKSVLVCSLPVF